MNIYCGGLPFSLKEDDLRGLFEEYGEVASAKIIIDKFSGRSKGFGFVEMPVEEEAQKAISELNGAQVEGRTITVNESEERRDNRRGNFGGGNRGSYNRGGGNRGGYQGGDY